MIYEMNINDITLDDINALIENHQEENKFLEYKQKIEKVAELDNISKIVCGFANANGGLFIYGLKEKEGKVQEIKGISLEKSWDEEKLRIQNAIINRSEPRIYFEIDKIDLPNTDKILILIKVPKSWNSPHRVKQGSNNKKFFYRRDGFTDELEFEELRNLFNLSNNLLEKIETFRDNRISEIFFNNIEGYEVIFHSIPFEAFSGKIINMKDIRNDLNEYDSLRGSYIPDFEGRYCEEGNYSCQLYRNGIFEKICHSIKENKNIDLFTFRNECINFIKDILDFYNVINISLPVIFYVSFLNIGDCYQESGIDKKYPISEKKKNVLISDSVMFQNCDETLIKEKIDNAFKPFWNHFGFEKN